MPTTMLRVADRMYCGKCIYRGNFNANYLCNFFALTGARRGCPAGNGCERREIEPAEKRDNVRVCVVCGVRYEGGPQSKMCGDCRREFHRQNALRMVELRKEKRNGRET